jgi:hypothetical protein
MQNDMTNAQGIAILDRAIDQIDTDDGWGRAQFADGFPAAVADDRVAAFLGSGHYCAVGAGFKAALELGHARSFRDFLRSPLLGLVDRTAARHYGLAITSAVNDRWGRLAAVNLLKIARSRLELLPADDTLRNHDDY